RVNYMLLLYVEDRPAPGTPEAQDAIAALGAYHGERQARGVLLAAEALGSSRDGLEARGVLVAPDPLAPPRSATTLRERAVRLVTTDGPFAETREWLPGALVVRLCDPRATHP